MLRSENKQGGVPITTNDCKAFVNCINECGLIELNFLGPQFTWGCQSVFE